MIYFSSRTQTIRVLLPGFCQVSFLTARSIVNSAKRSNPYFELCNQSSLFICLNCIQSHDCNNQGDTFVRSTNFIAFSTEISVTIRGFLYEKKHIHETRGPQHPSLYLSSSKSFIICIFQWILRRLSIISMANASHSWTKCVQLERMPIVESKTLATSSSDSSVSVCLLQLLPERK